MKQLISCEFNIDTACVELYFTDESRISIDCTAVENEVADNRFQRSELDWLIYNDPESLCRACSQWRSQKIPQIRNGIQTIKNHRVQEHQCNHLSYALVLYICKMIA